MAKAQLIARFDMDIAPSQLPSIIMRRRRALPRTMLDTIAEEEVVERPSYAPHSSKSKAPLPSWSYASRAREPGKSAVVHGEQKPAVHASPVPIVV
ncbi:hypothetical protein PR202_ga19010 [Eleusine coracana subsp. coracana]|uniref:Uncharacterized protein n=1 Tax=Eleusine coracana subsp. coracana TaxID=191504 RepID=A0AAV5CUM8_ELECO|nr:hypothetical protein PR202_ga19010 [Eleusine coracana subsp. coracana]